MPYTRAQVPRLHKLPMMNKDGTFGMRGGIATPPERGGYYLLITKRRY